MSNQENQPKFLNVSSAPPWSRPKISNENVTQAEPVIHSDLLSCDEAKAAKYVQDAQLILACAKQIYTVKYRTSEFDRCMANLFQIRRKLCTLSVNYLNPKICGQVSFTLSRISRYILELQSIENQQYSLLWQNMLILMQQSKLQLEERANLAVKDDTNLDSLISDEATESTYIEKPSSNLICDQTIELVPLKSPSHNSDSNCTVEDMELELTSEEEATPSSNPTFSRVVDLVSLQKRNDNPISSRVHKGISVRKPSNNFTSDCETKTRLKKSKNYNRKGILKNVNYIQNTFRQNSKNRNRCENKSKRVRFSFERNSSSSRSIKLSTKNSSLQPTPLSSTSNSIGSESQSKRLRSSKWLYHRENSSMSDSDEYENKQDSYFSSKSRANSSTLDLNANTKMQKPIVRYDREFPINPLIYLHDLIPTNYNEIPVQLFKITPSPPEDCIFCGLHHHSHVCTEVNTLERRLAFFNARNLCFKCSQPQHDRDCLSLEEFCKWHHCVATGQHHSAICPKATYPITNFEVEQYFDRVSAMRLKFCR